jgi:hypothetical protein
MWTEKDLELSYRLGYQDGLTKTASWVDLLHQAPHFLGTAALGHVALNSAILGARKIPAFRKAALHFGMRGKQLSKPKQTILNFGFGPEFVGEINAGRAIANTNAKLKPVLDSTGKAGQYVKDFGNDLSTKHHFFGDVKEGLANAKTSVKNPVSRWEKTRDWITKAGLGYASYLNPHVAAIGAVNTLRTGVANSKVGKYLAFKELQKGFTKGPDNRFVKGMKQLFISPSYGELRDMGAAMRTPATNTLKNVTSDVFQGFKQTASKSPTTPTTTPTSPLTIGALGLAGGGGLGYMMSRRPSSSNDSNYQYQSNSSYY